MKFIVFLHFLIVSFNISAVASTDCITNESEANIIRPDTQSNYFLKVSPNQQDFNKFKLEFCNSTSCIDLSGANLNTESATAYSNGILKLNNINLFDSIGTAIVGAFFTVLGIAITPVTGAGVYTVPVGVGLWAMSRASLRSYFRNNEVSNLFTSIAEYKSCNIKSLNISEDLFLNMVYPIGLISGKIQAVKSTLESMKLTFISYDIESIKIELDNKLLSAGYYY